MTTNLDAAAKSVLDAEYDNGARAVRLRFPTGFGKGAALAAFVAAKAKDGPILAIVPVALKEQFRRQLKDADPNLKVGDWGSGETVEVASPLHAGSRVEERSAGTFPWIVVDEAHRANAASINKVTAHFKEARILECLAMPRPHPGLVDVDADIDLGVDDFRRAISGRGI